MSATIKQVIVMRKDLNMRKGKMVAQGAHASSHVCCSLAYLSAFTSLGDYDTKQVCSYLKWMRDGHTKICVSVDGEKELFDAYNKAVSLDIPCYLVLDKGLTEFGEPTHTCCAIGPAESEEIDKITGSLKLL